MNLPRTPLRKIGLTCDFFRFEPQESRIRNWQNQNLEWLFNILNRKDLLQQSKVKVTLIKTPEDLKTFKSQAVDTEIIKAYTVAPADTWAKFYDCENVALFPALFAKLMEQDLIVGFEISPTIKRFLHAQGKPYLNLYIHPLRFLRDLCLGATTNAPFIARSLEVIELNELEIETQRCRFAALFSRLELPAFAIPRVPVLIGQTENDSILIESGRFVEWRDYDDQLTEGLEKFNTVVYLEHPNRISSNAAAVEHLRSRHRKTVISMNANGYGVLFSNRHIPRILTLSSSLGVEASVIGHKSQFLLADPRKKVIVAGIDLPILPTLGHKVLSREFWQSILEGHDVETSGRAVKENDFALGEHYLRNSLESWAYRSLQYGHYRDLVTKTILPTSSATSAATDKICATLVGQGNNSSTLTGVEFTSIGKKYGIDLHLHLPPLVSGEQRRVPLSSPHAGQYLIKGFHPPEDWGVWSSEHDSQLLLPIAEESVHLSITMKLKVYEGILDKAPVLSLSVQSKLLGHIFFRSSSQNEQQISLSIEARAPYCCIDFFLSDLGIPARDLKNNDQRTLGIALSEVVVNVSPPVAAGDEEQSSEYFLWGITPTAPVVLMDTQVDSNEI